MDNNMLKVIMDQNKNKNTELATILEINKKTEQFGLALTKEDAEELMVCRNECLKNYKRVEFGMGILDQLIFAFCDSSYITSDNYVETIERLQDIFYQFKNESDDKLTDDELIEFMREQFDTICFGDLDYLEDTCLQRFATAIRAGYEEYHSIGVNGAYQNFDEEARWDKNIFLTVLNDMF